MTTRIRNAAGLAVLCLITVLATTSCEDTGVTAPEGSAITLIAQPANISIDQFGGDTAGSTILRAQLLDSTGLPQKNVPLSFTTTGGVLASVSNVCVDLDDQPGSNCLRTNDACQVDSDCPIVEPIIPETDTNGLVNDVLVLRLFTDPESVEVTVQSNISTTSIMVGTNVNLGPDLARASLAVAPSDQARTGQEVQLNGASSTDGSVRITCYEFEITETKLSCNPFDPNNPDEPINCPETTSITKSRQTSSIFAKTYGTTGSRDELFNLSGLLRVSDDPVTAAEPCVDAGNRSREFSPFEDGFAGYEVRCDFTDPIVDGGNNKVRSLQTDGTATGELDGSNNEFRKVTIEFNAFAADPEFPTLTYLWDCGTQDPPVGGGDPSPDSTATCEYTSSTPTQFTATVTVWNICGLFSTDSVGVILNP